MNRLANETSPYLLQHAHNPVDWYPWGDEAFAKARAEDKPVFLSIGYSACHWCHVMERESFENEELAAVLNEKFVSIKVDREERPDVDSIYMEAVQMMTGHGGWPMSMFLTPAGAPFYAGTYFPPDDRHGMPGFRRVLEHVADAYRSRRTDVEAASAEVVRSLSTVKFQGGGTLEHDALDRAAARIAQSYDPANGGFGGAPKFPPSMSLDFLMQVAWRTKDVRLDEIIIHTLTKMARGGMYDQVGGGFHRYSVDAHWLVPHFEKMLYDNALLARLYTRAWQWKKDPFFARIAHEILGFVQREMTSPDGAFYATQDADSRRRRGQVLRLVARRGDVDSRRRGRAHLLRVVRHHRARQLGGPQHPQRAARSGVGGSRSRDLDRSARRRRRCAASASCTAFARSACGPPATKRSWPAGTAGCWRHSPRLPSPSIATVSRRRSPQRGLSPDAHRHKRTADADAEDRRPARGLQRRRLGARACIRGDPRSALSRYGSPTGRSDPRSLRRCTERRLLRYANRSRNA